MDRLDLIQLAHECHLSTKEVGDVTYVSIPTWQVDTFAYFPNSRLYAYRTGAKVVRGHDGGSYYEVPISYLELDKDFLPGGVKPRS